MTDFHKTRLAKLARDYAPPVCGGDIDAKRCAEVIIPILRDAIFELEHVPRNHAERLAREFVHAAAAQVAAKHNPRFVPRVR